MRFSRWILAVWLSVVIFGPLGTEAQLLEFRKVSPFPTASTKFKGGTYGAAKFVVVGERAIVCSFDNGISWQEGRGYPKTNWNAVTYGNGKFVAVGEGTQTASSADGINWTAQGLPGSLSLSRIVFGNGEFWTAGTPSSVRSQDGVSWSSLQGYGTIAFANGIFTSGGSYPTWLDSGCTNSSTCYQFGQRTDIVGVGNDFFGCALYSKPPLITSALFTSTGGSPWRLLQQGAGAPLFPVQGGVICSTLAGWAYAGSSPLPALPDTPANFCSSDSSVLLMGVNGKIWRSQTAAGPWSSENPPEIRINGAAANGRIFVGVGVATNSPGMVVSTEGLPSLRYAPAPDGSGILKSVRYADGRFVAVGNGGTIIRSLDGTNWTRRLSNTASDLMDVAWGAGAWVAVGAGGKILSSPDASFFNLSTSGTELQINGVTYGNGQFVAVGKDGLVLRSVDGGNWSAGGIDTVQELYSVTYGAGRFVATGTNGVVCVSTNARIWQYVTIPGVSALPKVAYGNGYYVATSLATNTIYYSTNAMDWTGSTTQDASWLGANFSDGELWLVGEKSGIWKTSLSASNPPKLSARLDINQRFVLSVDAALGGDYEVESTVGLPAVSWDATAFLPDVTGAGAASWTETNQSPSMKFYRAVRK